MDLNELREIIKILEESALSELEIEEEGLRVRLQKPGAAPVAMSMPAPAATAPAPPASAPTDGASASEPKGDKEYYAEQGLKTIDAPMVGTFYSAPSPGADPFVTAGDRVGKDDTVCIVEAMKLMNEVAAKFAGTIEKVLVENGEPVEFGQPLFAVRTA